MKTRMICISVIMFLSSNILSMNKDTVTRALSKMDSVSAQFVQDCIELHLPLTYDHPVFVIKNHYLRLYEAKRAFNKTHRREDSL
jgi:outer membrane lipoprotein-sorting protein